MIYPQKSDNESLSPPSPKKSDQTNFDNVGILEAPETAIIRF